MEIEAAVVFGHGCQCRQRLYHRTECKSEGRIWHRKFSEATTTGEAEKPHSHPANLNDKGIPLDRPARKDPDIALTSRNSANSTNRGSHLRCDFEGKLRRVEVSETPAANLGIAGRAESKLELVRQTLIRKAGQVLNRCPWLV